ncbi:MAG TPA: hypothetical protein V6C76_06780 [Drouetiella sp.]
MSDSIRDSAMQTFLEKTLARRIGEPIEQIVVPQLDFSYSRDLPEKPVKSFDRSKPFWLVSRNFDLLFVCGIAPWIAGLLMFVVTGSGGATKPTVHPQQALTLAFVVASLVIGESHQFTSIIRYYSTTFRKRKKPQVWNRIPVWLLYGLFINLILMVSIPPLQGILGMTTPFWMIYAEIAVSLFPVFLLHHVCAQACSIIQIYCNNSPFKFEKNERGVLNAFSWLLVATGACSIAMPFAPLTIPFFNIFFRLLPTNLVFPPLYGCTVAFAAVIFGSILTRGFRTGDWPPLSATLILANLTLLVLLPVPVPAVQYVWLFAPLLFHATQHWAVAWKTQEREAKAAESASFAGAANTGAAITGAAITGAAIAGGANNGAASTKVDRIINLVVPVMLTTALVLFVPLLFAHVPQTPSILTQLFPNQTLNVFFSMAVFYLHYFADRMVWRSNQ